MLTKEQIEAIEIGGRDDEWEMSGDLSMDDARELRRLALLGIERDERAQGGGWYCSHCGQVVAPADVTHDETHDVRAGGCGHAVGYRAFPQKRDERAERIGRAVLADPALTRFAIETAIDTIRNGDGFEADDIQKLRAIAAAMEEEA